MNNVDTMIYIGKHQEIAERFVAEGYLVNQISDINPNQFNEYMKHDDKIVKSARDTLEGDASVIIMDSEFLKGVDLISDRIEAVIKDKLRSNFNQQKNNVQYVKDSITEEIESILNRLPQKLETLIDKDNTQMSIDTAINNIFATSGNKYIQSVMKQMSKRLILGEENYNLLVNYIEKMKKSAEERIKNSRYDSGEKRDLLEDDDRWRPILILTSNEKLSGKTQSEDVRKEYLKMDLIKDIMNKNDMEISVPMVVNTRTEMGENIIVDTEKLVRAIKWTRFMSNAEEKNEEKKIADFAKTALEMFDLMDVDGSVKGHSLRTELLMQKLLEVTDKSKLASYYKIPKKEWNSILIGALLHDNGKLLNISRPDLPNFLPSLQTNSGFLNQEGNQARLSHAEIGGDNIKHVIEDNSIKGNKDILKNAVDMAYYHQEFYKGDKGYSKDKKHEDRLIPLTAQYMAIVDVFDAIVSNRNYNKATTLEETIEIMASQGGIQIMQQDDDGKVKPAIFKNWCMTKDTKFEIKDGHMSVESLHFNPHVLKCFLEFLQSEAMKFRAGEKTFIKLEKDKDVRAQGYRSIVTGIGSVGFEKNIHRETREIDPYSKNSRKLMKSELGLGRI